MHPECESLTFVPHLLILFFLLCLLLYLFLSTSFSSSSSSAYSSPSTALPLLLLSASCSKSVLQQFGEHTVLSHSLWCVYDCLWAELCDSQQIDELHTNQRLMCGLAEPKDMGFTRPVLAMWKCPGHCPGLWHNRSGEEERKRRHCAHTVPQPDYGQLKSLNQVINDGIVLFDSQGSKKKKFVNSLKLNQKTILW